MFDQTWRYTTTPATNQGERYTTPSSASVYWLFLESFQKVNRNTKNQILPSIKNQTIIRP